MNFRFFSIVFVILLGTAVHAANVNVTTFYGKTGGIVGVLNTTTQVVNGRTICPSDPTIGCDFDDEPLFNNNGTTDNPHDDSYSGDLLIRTNDSFQATAGWLWNGEAGGAKEKVTIKGTLPAIGTLPDGTTAETKSYKWDTLPGGCDADESSISDDKQTMVCVRKDFDKNDVGTYSEDLPFNVIVKGEALSGTKPGDVTFEISAEDATTITDDTDGYSLTVTAAPRWNLQKSYYTVRSQQEVDGVKGWIMDYKFYIEVDEVTGEIDNASALLGNESMGKDATFTFTDDLSGVSPNAKLIDCSMNGRYANRDGHVGSADPRTYAWDGYSERSIPQEKGEQQISCTQSGNSISIQLEHIDATLSFYPTQDWYGRALPVNRGIAAIGSIYVFVPVSDVQDGEDGERGTDDDEELRTTNVLTNFDPVTPTGNQNFGGERESEKDNSISYTLYYTSRGSFNKYYRGEKASVWTYPGEQTTNRSGMGMVTKGYEFSTVLILQNSRGVTSFSNDKACDVVDAYRLDVQDIEDNTIYNTIKTTYTDGYHHGNKDPMMYRVWNGKDDYTNGLDEEPYILEYASSYEDDSWLPSRGGDNTVSHEDKIVAECSADDTKWFASADEARNDANGIGAITKVRMTLRPDIVHPDNSYTYFWLNHKVRGADLKTAQPLDHGDELANFSAYSFNDDPWKAATYKTMNFPEPHSGSLGDRVIFSGPKARIIKDVDRVALTAGDTATFNLKVSFTNDTGIQEFGTVKVTDLLPKGLKYIKGSVSEPYVEPVIGTCADVDDINSTETPCLEAENQVLIWDLGLREAGEIFPDINYSTLVGVEVNAGTIRNVAKIEAPTDASPISQRRSEVGMSVSIPASINIVKSTEENQEYLSLRERTTVEKDINFLMDMRNGKAGEITDLDVIDILPFQGDAMDGAIKFNDLGLKRKIATNFHGTGEFRKMKLIEHSLSSSLCDLEANGGVKYYYTGAIPTTINIAPTVGSANEIGNADSIWCEGDENGPNGCNGLSSADVTAVRAAGPRMEPQAICQFKVSLKVNNNLAGDNYSNSAGASATGITLPVLSNSLAVPIVGSSLGNKIWFDKNLNGIQDLGEAGVSGIKVHLLDSAGQSVANPLNPDEAYIVTSDIDGNYLFDKINSGSYYVQFDLPEKFLVTEKGIGSNSELDSNIDATGRTELISVGREEDDLSIDAGIYSLISLGDTVWYDNNKDGIQDSSEVGVNGVKVTLYDEDGSVVGTQITDDKGSYLFKDLVPKNYLLGFTDLPSGYGISPKDITDDEQDSDVDPVTGKTDLIVMDKPIDMLNIDMGIYKNDLAILGDTVWYDDNKDGKQDVTERGVNGVKVTLFDNNGVEVTSTVTDAQGTYLFRDVVPATYTVGFSDLPAAYTISPMNEGEDDTKDSDIDPVTGKSSSVTLVVGENNLDIDMGIYNDKLATLGDSVWFDSNKDGIQDSSERGARGVKVTLYNTQGDVVQTTVTDGAGTYLFRDVVPASYTVGFSDLPPSYAISPKANDSKVDPSTGKTDTITLEVGENNLNADMGIYNDELSSLGDTVWYDDNKDGVQNSTEKGVNGVKVTLYSGADIVATTVTDAQGNYLFKDLVAGDYSVEFTDLPATYVISPKQNDSKADATGKTDPITLAVGENTLDTDMGIYNDKLAILGDTVWYDDDKDGVQDATERGVNGVKVTLFDSNGAEVMTTITDKQGVYLFREVTPATYTVGFSDLPASYKISEKVNDSKVNPATGRTDEILLEVGDTKLDADMGIYNDELATLGDTVWYDNNRDGKQDATERGVSGVKVILLDSRGTVLASTLTDEQGTYLFRDLTPATYQVKFSDLPASYVISPKDTTSDSLDSDVNVTTSLSDAITLGTGENNLDVDMGIYSNRLATLGDTVWYDDNKDGKQDTSERGVNGVKVTLFDSNGDKVTSTVTDEQGVYLFTDIVPATYRVGFSNLPASYVISSKVNDSKVDPASGKTDTLTLVEGENKLNVDMGIYTDKLATLGDTVWYDDNRDGKQDTTERGVNGVKVTLFDSNGAEVASTITDEQGVYLFRDIAPASYTVGFSDLPLSYVVSPKVNDSKVNPATGKTDAISLSVGENNLTADMGIYNDKLATLGDTVWYDSNKDGKQDSTERGVNGVKVTLFDSAGKEVASTITDEQGNYLFRDIIPATYTVKFTDLPIAYQISPKQNDSKVDPTTGKTDDITLVVGENNLTADMGIYNDKLAILGDTVWYDDNKDGIQDSTERGVNGVKVTLLDSNGNEVALTVTDEQGNYLFRDLVPATYKVEFSNLPASYVISPKDVTTDSLDSDVDAMGKTEGIILTVGENNLNVDMGIYNDKLATLGDTVWYDDNKDGKQDATERGVNGVKVTLFDSAGKEVASTVTDEQGNYLFRDVVPATYTVGFTDLPSAYKISPKENDSTADQTSGKTDPITLVVGENNLDADMGIYNDKLATLGDTVWYDDNKDGKQDATERGVNGVKVTLFDSTGKEVASTVTDEQGNYLFRGVVPATYTVGFTDLPSAYKISPKENDSTADQASGKTDPITLVVGENNLDIDMGIYNDKLATLGDTVWYDDNKDGKQDATEKGVRGVKVTLYNGTDVIATTVTDEQGNYLFRDVIPATYTVGFTDLPSAYKISPKENDSKADQTSGKTDPITLAVGENNLNVDMGIYNDELATLGDTVWYDDNKDGKQDATEKGVRGVKVTLYNGTDVIATTVTDEQGNYLFRGVVPATYTVGFSNLPAAYVISPKDATRDSLDSDVEPSTGKTDDIILGVGENNLDADMGIYNDKLAILGDTVWYDDNKDGKQDATERGVNGVKVTLFDSAEKEVASTVTDEQGNYLFRDVIPATYTVRFTDLPATYIVSPQENDSKADATGETEPITLAVGENNLDADMGIYNDKLAILGDTVWFDDNKDGKQDATEKGVNGVKVTLYKGTDVIATTVTDEQGNYLFRDVIPATYTVGFTDLPATYVISPKDKTSDSLDSDVEPSTGKTDDIILDVGENNLDADMGIYNDKLATLGDTVWYDDNKDGKQDATEKGVHGVKVTLYNRVGVKVALTVTDEQGNYLFRDLVAGDYSVEFTDLPATYVISPQQNDSKADATGKTDPITLAVGENNLNVDMGIYNDELATLGDTVWYDDNKDGKQDATEKGVRGVKVTLYNGTDVIATTVTDEQGNYLFRDVVPATYTVGFSDLPASYVISPKDTTTDSLDSDVEPSTGKTDDIILAVGENNLDADMGIYNDKLATLGDTVWYDDNKDGKQDATERGVNGVKVTLFDSAGKEVASTVTDEQGNYLFRDVVPAIYTVGFTDLPSAYKISPKENDSKVDPTTGKTDPITLVVGENNLDADMGIYNDKLATLGDAVWYDDNRNGIQDREEKGVNGVKVTLFDFNEVKVASTVTDEQGNYLFRDLVPSEYTVEFTNLPASYLISPKDKGVDDAKDSDTDEITGKTDPITLVVGENNLDADMGIYSKRFVTVGDAVWYDDNRDGVQDNDEKGVEAIKVTLFDSAGEVVARTTTDRNGIYQFKNVLPGVYSLGFTDLPVDYIITPKAGDSVVNPETGRTVTFEVQEGDIDLSMDMGIYTNSLGTIGDAVWYDDNRDGIQDATERGVEAIKVTLFDENGVTVVTTTTDVNGNYQFRDLSVGTYRVGFSALPVGYLVSPKDIGDDSNNSDVNVATKITDPIVLSEGSHDLSVDMGIYREDRAIIGNSVWYDDNRNGIQDVTEKGAEAVKVELFSSDGTLVTTTTTDEDGHYQFRNLVAGNYYVKVSDLPVGYEITKQNEGSDETDSDVDAFGKTVTIDLKEGDVVTNVDMGIFNRQRATIGSHVWYDENRNGLQDSFEKGVEAVKVTLYDESNNLVSTTTTDRNGLYQFRDLLPARYHVGFSELPVGYQITVKNAQNDTRDSEDSDADALTGETVVTILSEGENDVTWDMGIYNAQRASIGDVVWYDDDKNGIQGDNEFGVDAVKVTLHRGDDSVVGTTITDAKGNYKFGNLLPDNYYVVFSDLPVGYRATEANNGSDVKDSDADVSTLRTETTHLDAGENDLSWDMGIHNELRASIGNSVWYDDNKNGLQDAYEFGVGAVKATLHTQSGDKVAETLTDDRGNYAFRNLLPDSYYVEFSELPAGYEVSPKHSGDTSKDSDVDASTLRTDMITVIAGENSLSWDMGLFNQERASIGNKVWFDTNHDGLQDITEKGVSAVKVTLYDAEDNVVKTTRTNQYGEYIFRDLVPAEYYIGFSEFPATYMITKQNVNDAWKEDSDANYHRGHTIHTTLEAGENDLSWDVGIYVPTLVNIGDKVWYDNNRNGIQDSSEAGVKNIRVTLVKNGIPQIPSEQTTTATTSLLTDENGAYLFENIEALAPHEYHIMFDIDTLPKDYLITRQDSGDDDTLDSDVHPVTGETEDVFLTMMDDFSWDMGIQTLYIYDDSAVANTDGPVTTVDVLGNDNGDINRETIKFLNTSEGEILWNNGTVVGGTTSSLSDKLVVPGEGTWSVHNGKIIFTAEDGFEGIPSPIYYVVEGESGTLSNVGQVKITTPCTCETYTSGENSVSALSYWSILLLLLSISAFGVTFARREFDDVR